MMRWGIIGLGRIADTEIAPAITTSPHGELRGVVSRDQGRADAFAGRHGAARALTSFDELLADPEVDAVYIATPNALHAGQVVVAAAAGKHVMCDKPLALSVADAQRAVAACEEAAVQLGITFQTRFHDHFGRFREVIQDGSLGEIRVVQVEMSPGRTLLKGWRTDPALALRALSDGAGNSRMLEIRGPMMVEGDFSHANIALEVFQKDIDLINDLARTARCPLPLFSAAAQLHLAAMAQGRLGEDPACVFAVLEGMTAQP